MGWKEQEDIIVNQPKLLKRRRNNYGKKIRKDYEKGNKKATMKEMRDWEQVEQPHANSLSGVQIDNLIVNQPKKENGIKIYDPLNQKFTAEPTALRTNSSNGNMWIVEDSSVSVQPKKEKEEPTIIENFYQKRSKAREYKKKVPSLRVNCGGLLVSGQTSGTSTQPKSTGKGSRKDSPYKGGHGKIHNPQDICHCLEDATSGGGGTSNRPMIKVVGDVGNGHEAQNVYDPEGIAPTVRENHGKTTKIRSHSPRTNDPKKGGSGPLESTEHCFTVDSTPHLVMDTGTNPQSSTRETSEQLTLLPYQNTTSSVGDFLANLSALLGSEEDLKILEAHSSLRYAESYRLSDLRFYSLRMSKDSSRMMKEIPSKPSSERWMNWGMTVNGRCLTAKISESRRTGSECLLSDILEDNPDPKYFLSEKQVVMMEKWNTREKPLEKLRQRSKRGGSKI